MGASQILTSRCGACGCRLRVKTHSAEKLVACPKCGAQTTVRQTSPPPDPPSPQAAGDAVVAARPETYEFPCHNCAGALRARRELTGRLVKCRHCAQTVRVPPSPEDRERELAEARAEKKVSPLAYAALFLGAATMIVPFLGPVTLTVGILALNDIKKGRNKVGIGRAIVGIFWGVVGSLLTAFCLLLVLAALLKG